MIAKNTMPSLKKVGTKLGERPASVRASANSPATTHIVEYFHQHPAQLLTEKDLPEHLQSRSQLDNCFHSGYVLRILPESGQDYLYFYPNSSQIDWAKQKFVAFEALIDDRERSEQKAQLIQELFDNIVNQNQTNSSCTEENGRSEETSNKSEASLKANIQQQIQQLDSAIQGRKKQIQELESQNSKEEEVLKTLKSLLENY